MKRRLRRLLALCALALSLPTQAQDPEFIGPAAGLITDARPLGDGALMTLHWTSPPAADVHDWAIYVGTEPGDWDIQRITHMNRYFLDDRPTEEKLVLGIPADGSTFHVRLFWRSNGQGFQWIDRTYVAPSFPQDEPSEFVLNAGLNDAWYNPATAGQGVFVNVFPELGKVFIAMFTFDEGGAAEGASATLGGPGQRWLTAIGDFTGNRVELDVGYTTGGVFDSASPAPNTVGGQGTLVLEFSDCGAGTLSYDLPGAGVSGTIPLERVVK
ncbi:MAG: hypothetical protein AAGH19_06485, partial [Pseudomonadota bacterium]